jgi:hypothetical protein
MTPSAIPNPHRLERNAVHFTIRIALLLSNRPILIAALEA